MTNTQSEFIILYAKTGRIMPERDESNAADTNGQDRIKARLRERILQLSELNRAYLLGTELALFFAQHSKSCEGENSDDGEIK